MFLSVSASITKISFLLFSFVISGFIGDFANAAVSENEAKMLESEGVDTFISYYNDLECTPSELEYITPYKIYVKKSVDEPDRFYDTLLVQDTSTDNDNDSGDIIYKALFDCGVTIVAGKTFASASSSVQDSYEFQRKEFDNMINGRCYVWPGTSSGQKFGENPMLSKLCTAGTNVISGSRSSQKTTTGFGVVLFSLFVAVNLFYL